MFLRATTRSLSYAALIVVAGVGWGGCQSSSAGVPDAAADAAAVDGPIGGSRPVVVHVPPGYDSHAPAPLVIMLHGFSSSGVIEETYLRLTAQSDARGFLYAYPDGTANQMGQRFWNATDACCNFEPPMIDDSAYLSDLISQIGARYSVDPKRVFFVGHSNGGFMAYRMACDHSDQIAAIVSLAGAMVSDLSKCPNPSPVNVLQIHGTADQTIPFAGGQNQGHAFPGAATSVADWVDIDGCASTADMSAPALDLDLLLPGNETTVSKYSAGCKPGGHVELWTIQGGSHIPALGPSFAGAVVDFLYAHPKP